MKPIKPQKLELLVTESVWENPKILKITFKVQRFEDFKFYPGQHITIITDSKVARAYSIYANKCETDEISMILSAGHDGEGVNYFKKLKKGDLVTGLGPLGKHTLDEKHMKNIFFAASGVGGAPLMTMVHKLCTDKVKNKVRFYIGFRYEEDTVFEKELKELKDTMHDFDYVICYSKPKDKKAKKGYVSDFLNIEDPKNSQIYICGVEQMGEDTKTAALKHGIDIKKITLLR